jgi:hypothetical protein
MTHVIKDGNRQVNYPRASARKLASRVLTHTETGATVQGKHRCVFTETTALSGAW